jgi:hypothetical protein
MVVDIVTREEAAAKAVSVEVRLRWGWGTGQAPREAHLTVEAVCTPTHTCTGSIHPARRHRPAGGKGG